LIRLDSYVVCVSWVLICCIGEELAEHPPTNSIHSTFCCLSIASVSGNQVAMLLVEGLNMLFYWSLVFILHVVIIPQLYICMLISVMFSCHCQHLVLF